METRKKLELFEKEGMMKEGTMPGCVGPLTFDRIVDAYEHMDDKENPPHYRLGYKSAITLGSFFSRNIPGYKRPRGLHWNTIFESAELKTYRPVLGIGKNDVVGNISHDNGLDREYLYWRNMLKQVNNKEEISICEEWTYFSKFLAWYRDQPKPAKGARLTIMSDNLYSADTTRFFGGV